VQVAHEWVESRSPLPAGNSGLRATPPRHRFESCQDDVETEVEGVGQLTLSEFGEHPALNFDLFLRAISERRLWRIKSSHHDVEPWPGWTVA
jgi:hypothetical protein